MSMFRRGLKPVGALTGVCALLLIVFVLILWMLSNRTVTLPQPTGSYPVGRADFDWVDQTRAETLGPDPHAKRELMVSVWYPAVAPPPGTAPAPYLPGLWAKVRQEDGGIAGSLL